MASATDFAARGIVTSVNNGQVVFAPSNTNYQLHLDTDAPYKGPVGQLIWATIRAKARKVYTVPSGGGFITPLFGTPKIVQGRALHVEDRLVVIKAGVPVVVELPASNEAVDLASGPISVGSIVNAVTLRGATFALIPSAEPAGV